MLEAKFSEKELKGIIETGSFGLPPDHDGMSNLRTQDLIEVNGVRVKVTSKRKAGKDSDIGYILKINVTDELRALVPRDKMTTPNENTKQMLDGLRAGVLDRPEDKPQKQPGKTNPLPVEVPSETTVVPVVKITRRAYRLLKSGSKNVEVPSETTMTVDVVYPSRSGRNHQRQRAVIKDGQIVGVTGPAVAAR